jgi:hypothetical protein
MKTTTLNTINPYTNTATKKECLNEDIFEQQLNPDLFTSTFFFPMNEDEEFKILGRISSTDILYTDNTGEEFEIKLNAFARIMEVREKPIHPLHHRFINDNIVEDKEELFIELKSEEVKNLEIENIYLEDEIKNMKEQIKNNKKSIKKINAGEKGEIISEEEWHTLKEEIRAFRLGKEVIWRSNQSYVDDNGISRTNWFPVVKEEDFNMFYKFMIVF